LSIPWVLARMTTPPPDKNACSRESSSDPQLPRCEGGESEGNCEKCSIDDDSQVIEEPTGTPAVDPAVRIHQLVRTVVAISTHATVPSGRSPGVLGPGCGSDPSTCAEIECVKATQGPSFGSLWCLSAVLIGSVALVVGIAAALGVAPLSAVVSVAIGGLIGSVWLQRVSIVTVDADGVQWRVVGTERSAPWSDIERVEGRLLTGWLVRKSSSKRVYFSALDPQWKGRAVTEAIQAHLTSGNPPTVA
jgi:hypothetical protein